MSAINRIIQYLNDASDYFYDIYLEVYYWTPPFNYIAPAFYQLSSLFANISWQFYYFNRWVEDVIDKVAEILDFSDIYSHFRSYFDKAIDAWNWVKYAFWNVVDIVDNWWDATKLTVLGWINTARQALQSAIDTVSNALYTLKAAWDNFKGKIPSIDEIIAWFRAWSSNVVSTMITWGVLTATQIADLLNSKIKELEPFWAGWQELREQVVDFFGDPGKWFIDRIEGWLERFW